jgi:hypothetical protein
MIVKSEIILLAAWDKLGLGSNRIFSVAWASIWNSGRGWHLTEGDGADSRPVPRKAGARRRSLLVSPFRRNGGAESSRDVHIHAVGV